MKFFSAPNDVILCAGDKNGLIPTKYFKEIKNIQTGAQIDIKPSEVVTQTKLDTRLNPLARNYISNQPTAVTSLTVRTESVTRDHPEKATSETQHCGEHYEPTHAWKHTPTSIDATRDTNKPVMNPIIPTTTDCEPSHVKNSQGHELEHNEKHTQASPHSNNENFTYFWSGTSPFSQHYITDFTINDIRYNSTEQYMMQQKALLFKDYQTANLIMQSKCPKEQKRLGRTVYGFIQSVWDEHSYSIVHEGNYNKFNQNNSILKTLEATKGTTLVEASLHDDVWGIGLTQNDPRALLRNTWRGQNKLGEILTNLRNDVFLQNPTSNHLPTQNKAHINTQDDTPNHTLAHQNSSDNKNETKTPKTENFTFFNGVNSI